ncbi:bifunctional methionine sulfoxide reductase B/A protein [Sulfurimonas sp.]
MKIIIFLLTILFTSTLQADSFRNLPTLELNHLTSKEAKVILGKDTERPYSGKYYKFNQKGTYLCKHCNAPLYKSSAKFDSGCGWPSFDAEIPGAVKRILDADGRRTEIVCARCGGHLGHVFVGEGFTPKNIRHCVNSISLKFQDENDVNLAKAYFAGGCFWGVEYYLEKEEGVVDVVSGYMGGDTVNPTYQDVTKDNTGHMEVVEVTYNPKRINYESLARLFFEIHDPTQKNGQGPDIGERYKSAVFVSNPDEKRVIEKLIYILKQKGYDVATKIKDKKIFYKAEGYHQDYYQKKGYKPYCHGYVKRF